VSTSIVRCLILAIILLGSDLLASDAECVRPLQIGVLTEAWGSTVSAASLRDGLRKLGYCEQEQFVIGVRSREKCSGSSSPYCSSALVPPFMAWGCRRTQSL
jgi:hypothetical protein